MKNKFSFVLMLVVALMLSSFNLSAQLDQTNTCKQGIKRDFTNAGKGKDAVVKIKANVTCDKCKAKIEKNLSFVKGVKDVDANVETKVVTIRYNSSKTNENILLNEVQKVGRGGEIIKEDAKSKCTGDKTKCTKSDKKQCCGAKSTQKTSK